MKSKAPTIELVLHKSGDVIKAKDFFKDQHLQERQSEIFIQRSEVERHIQAKDYLYVCIYCKQPIKIVGGGQTLKSLHFKHLKDSEDCHIKNNFKYTEEEIRCIKYNGAKEGSTHFELKHFIGEYLKYDSKVLNVNVDKVHKSQIVSKIWRKPDVFAELIDKKIVFEIQLSTTFLKELVGRNEFYRREGIFIIWVFNSFSLNSDLQPFTQKDIYYNNSFNVFVLDQEAKDKSIERKKLILKCYYNYVFEKNGEVYKEWKVQFVTIHDLKYNSENYKALFYNSDDECEKIIQQNNNNKIIIKNNVERTYEYLKQCYRENIKPDIKYFLVKTLDEFNFLNEKLKLNQEDILKKILCSKKLNFISFILENKNIIIDENIAFLEILKCNENQPWKNFLCLLFKRNYQPSQELLNITMSHFFNKKNFIMFLFGNRQLFSYDDELSFKEILKLNIIEYRRVYLCLLFEKNYQPTRDVMNDLKFSNFEEWSFCKLLFECQKTHQCIDLIEINNARVLQIIYSLFSLKENYIIGFKFNNPIQISNHILEYYKEYGKLYLKALEIYHKYNDQLNYDYNGTLKKKIENFYNQNVSQEKLHNKFISKLFPELFKDEEVIDI